MTPLAQKIEALLFLAGEAVALRELKQVLAVSSGDLEQALAEITQTLSSHGLALVTTQTHVQLVTSPSVAAYVSQYIQDETKGLSAAAAETLAIIAYRGPMKRIDIEAIRGIDCRRMIRQLLMRGLIRKTSEVGDRWPTYVVTEEFLAHLGLTDRSELPQFDLLAHHEKLQELLSAERN